MISTNFKLSLSDLRDFNQFPNQLTQPVHNTIKNKVTFSQIHKYNKYSDKYLTTGCF